MQQLITCLAGNRLVHITIFLPLCMPQVYAFRSERQQRRHLEAQVDQMSVLVQRRVQQVDAQMAEYKQLQVEHANLNAAHAEATAQVHRLQNQVGWCWHLWHTSDEAPVRVPLRCGVLLTERVSSTLTMQHC